MAKKDKKKVSKIKIKKKLWFKIVAPKIFGQKEVGETYLQSADKAVGRSLYVNLRDLTGSPRDQNTHIGLKITKVDGALLRTETIGYKLVATYIKRAVRKNTNRLDDNFTFKTKDGKNLIVKTLMVTLNKAQRSTCSNLRVRLQELLEAEVAKGDLDYFVSQLITRKVQGPMKRALAKIHPLREVAVRVIELKKERGVFGKSKELEVEPVSREESQEESVESNKSLESDVAQEESAPETDVTQEESTSETDVSEETTPEAATPAA